MYLKRFPSFFHQKYYILNLSEFVTDIKQVLFRFGYYVILLVFSKHWYLVLCFYA